MARRPARAGLVPPSPGCRRRGRTRSPMERDGRRSEATRRGGGGEHHRRQQSEGTSGDIEVVGVQVVTNYFVAWHVNKTRLSA